MSNHPIHSAPPYWGTPSYSQPWTTPQPPSSGPIPQPQTFNPEPSSTPQQYHNLESYYGNANLPGLGGAGATGTFPPPPFAFPGSFPPAPAPPHLTMPHMGYPLMPEQLPTHSHAHQPQPQPSTNNLLRASQTNVTNSQPMAITSSKQNLDREEGELTDLEGTTGMEKRGSRHPNGRTGGNWKYHGAGNGRDHGLQAEKPQLVTLNALHTKHDDRSAITADTRRDSPSEIEEGEASPEPNASSRDSGSPYNPPMPTEAISPLMPKSLLEPIKTTSEGMGALDPLLPSSVDQNPSSGYGVSLAQLRVQAQGALLSLAPHSIRYSELVTEGINSTILKQLYEEVGIKVPATPVANLDPMEGSSDDLHPGASSLVINEKENQPTQQLETQHDATPKLPSVEARPTLHSNQPNTAKPMERKDMIARMLAAKAAKSSAVPAPAQPNAEITVPSSQAQPSAVEKSTTTTSRDTSVNEKETRVKEKNKAQTELARQRIEQLKKQGLMRNLQKPLSDSLVPEKEVQNSVQEAPQAHASSTVQHPLPERPPIPESAPLDQIPGLFMTENVPEGINPHLTPIQESIPESTPHPRSSQRKRPRASDFDEPIPLPKRAFSNGTSHEPPERLVIDISDDEFYGDEDDANAHAETTFADAPGALTAEALVPVYPSLADGLPHRPATSQSQGLSTSSTPNILKNGEQEDLRKKDLEIQAMHRRIAELEQRKKAKLASRTQSPRASDLSPPELVNMPEMSTSSLDKDVDEILGPMDADGLRKMKSKILRIQEIEAGVPSLDAEIHKSEMKLADARSEAERLSSELAKGKEGREQLLHELKALKLEVSGLSLDCVNVALIDLEAKEKMPVDVVQAQGYENKTLEEDTSAVLEVPEADEQAQEDTTLTQHTTPRTSHSPTADHVPNVSNVDISVPDAPAAEPSDTSMSEDSSSSMDESIDDSSSDSGSLNEEIRDAQDPNMSPTEPVEEIVPAAEGLPNGPRGPQPEDTLFTDKAGNTPTQTDILSSAGGAEPGNLDSRESPASDAYEPPEPEESASASDTSYSPAPSPDFPSPAANMEISGSSEEQSQVAGEPLTEKVQELDFQQPSQYSQIGLLDNKRRPEDSQRKFSPYNSPLKLFKAYRYHSDYNDKVPGGYRSLTYSHNINPLKHFCPFETSGGVCNDRSCEYQHFRDVALSDDKILVQMGSLREGKTPEECDSYVAGLKETINDMRRDKVKDMNTVATEIAAYRRRFLQDPTRVLAL